MKRILCFVLCLIMLCALVGCKSGKNPPALTSGFYYAAGQYEVPLTPYVHLQTESKSLFLGEGTALSYAEQGTYKVKDNKIVATTQNTVFTFEIKDPTTLVLIEIKDPQIFNALLGKEFILGKALD